MQLYNQSMLFILIKLIKRILIELITSIYFTLIYLNFIAQLQQIMAMPLPIPLRDSVFIRDRVSSSVNLFNIFIKYSVV